MLHKSSRFSEIVSGARAASISTHGGALALTAAAATAVAVSAAIDGADAHEIFELARRAAGQAAILLAANIGGASDSVASIAGAILGARHPRHDQ
jgi:ADP-ribosylglycohydrolase